jgi:hypothetical protein
MRYGDAPMRPARAPAYFLSAAALLTVSAVPAAACDICSIYSATELRESRTGLELGVGEQLTRYATLKKDGREVDNPAGEFVNSSITQILVGYNPDPRWGLQLNLPIISRTFRRAQGGGIERGNETGVGDLSLVGILRPYTWVGAESVLRFSLLGGLKLPSGSSDRLREELEEDPKDAAEPVLARVGDARADVQASGVHGHDLALGSGSLDGVIGGSVFWSWRRLFATTSVQYSMRTRGSFRYRYANDVVWYAGPGAFLLLGHDYTLAAQALLSGEHKGKDELGGQTAEDTAITAVSLGPRIAFTWGTSLAMDVAAELPVIQDNSSLQIVPDYRLRGGMSWRF